MYVYTLIGYNNDVSVWRTVFHKMKIQVLEFSKRNSKLKIFDWSKFLLDRLK